MILHHFCVDQDLFFFVCLFFLIMSSPAISHFPVSKHQSISFLLLMLAITLVIHFQGLLSYPQKYYTSTHQNM